MREIRIYGALATFLKRRVFRAEVTTPAEAVRFLIANFPAVEKFIVDRDFRVSVEDRDLAIEEIHDPIGQQVIKIMPVVAGAGAAGRIIAGVALVALAIAAPYIAGAAVWGGALSYGAGSALISAAPFIGAIGASLALGGISQLLTPTPTLKTGSDSSSDPRKNYSFSSIQNTSRQGIPVPIVYGETIVGSIVISAGVDITQVAA